MVDVAEVRLWGQRIGAVSWNQDRAVASFQYTSKFVREGLDVAPLTMPLDANRVYSFPALDRDAFTGLPGMLSDSLPDRWGTEVMNQWLASQGRPLDSYSPVERLMYIGVRGMGALEYHPAIRGMGRSETVSTESLADVATTVLLARSRSTSNLDVKGLESLLQVGTSAGGVRAKAVVAWNPVTDEMRSGQVQAPTGFQYWLIKFDGVGSTDGTFTDPKGHGRVEMAYYLMARAAGIDMSESRIHLDGGGRSHFMTKRFDRTDDGSKLHVQTYQALTHRDYNQAGSHSWEAALLVTTQRCGFGAASELFRRMVFNVMARNRDDHTKNIAYMMDSEGSWRLSPAYDLTYASNSKSLWTSSHQMTMNAKTTGISIDDLIAVANVVGIRNPGKIISAVRDSVSQWATFAEEVGVADSFNTRIAAALRADLL